jgi:hypothetical protein
MLYEYFVCQLMARLTSSSLEYHMDLLESIVPLPCFLELNMKSMSKRVKTMHRPPKILLIYHSGQFQSRDLLSIEPILTEKKYNFRYMQFNNHSIVKKNDVPI